MMFPNVMITVAIYFVCGLQLGTSYRILGVFPTASISHQVVFRALTLALNEQGHELVVVTPDPINNPELKKYTEIDMSFMYKTHGDNINYIKLRREQQFLDFVHDFADTFMTNPLDIILGHPDVKKIYAPHSDEKFDLLLIEMLLFPGLYPLAERFDVPIIGITSFGITLNNQYLIGDPILSASCGNWELECGISGQSSFWQRLKIFVNVWNHLYWYETTFLAKQTMIAKKHFGKNISDLNEIGKKVSLIFVNQQDPISYIRPSSPKVINIGGSHVTKQVSTLSEDLKKFLDEATSGFVYMSLGTNVKSTMMPKKTINAFITAFSKLPYKVLWKFEDDVLQGIPDNIRITKWTPQQAVLAHPNLKVFIYQGGLQSTEEAVAHAVPLIGFPVIADQEMQVTKMVSLGVALKLEITDVDSNELYEAINTIANDSSYKQKMINLRSVVADKPYDVIKHAVWWTEYVIRHKGAHHLHSNTADEPWYKRQDMDIVAFISAGSVIVLNILLVILYRIVRTVFAYNLRSHNSKSKMH